MIVDQKKGAQSVMTIWWTLAIAIVSVLIVMVVFNYLNAPIDVRDLHSRILFTNVYDCIVDNGYIDPSILDDRFDLEKSCNINFSMVDNEKGFIHVSLIDKNLAVLKDFKFGQNSFIKFCEVEMMNRQGDLYCFSNNKVVNYYNSSAGEQESFLLKIDIGMRNLGVRNSK